MLSLKNINLITREDFSGENTNIIIMKKYKLIQRVRIEYNRNHVTSFSTIKLRLVDIKNKL